MGKAICKIDTCEDGVFSRGWCSFHYGRWYALGDPEAGPPRRKRRPPVPKAEPKICKVDTCDDPARSHGWCMFHHNRAEKYDGDPLGGPPRRARPGAPKPECKAPDCTDPARTRGWCVHHYGKLYFTGDALAPDKYTPRGAPLRERIEMRVDKNGPVPEHRPDLGPCWVWTGYLNADGYGVTGVGPSGKTDLAHRVAYMEFVGPIPEGKELDHLCRNRACARWSHLEPVTHAVNVKRGDHSKKRKRAA